MCSLSNEYLHRAASTTAVNKNHWTKTSLTISFVFFLVETEGMREAEKLVCILAGLALTAIQRLQGWVSAQFDSKMNQKVILNASGAQQLTSTNCEASEEQKLTKGQKQY